MKVAITGGTGLIGSALTRSLRAAGHEVVVLSRRPAVVEGLATVPWDPAASEVPAVARDGVDAFVNLAGASIADGRWDDAHRRAILDSRLTTTRRLVEAMGEGGPATLVSGSAVGYYGPGEDPVDETAGPGDDFLAEVCVRWEAEAGKGPGRGRVVLLRTGVVLSTDGGALPRLVRATRLGAGGPLGGGRQWQSWIHIADEVGLIEHVLADTSVSGPVNAAAPNAVRQLEMAQALGRVLHRPASLPTPAFAIRVLMGRAADVALTGQHVVPAVALRSGYEFRFSHVLPALADLLTPAHAAERVSPRS